MWSLTHPVQITQPSRQPCTFVTHTQTTVTASQTNKSRLSIIAIPFRCSCLFGISLIKIAYSQVFRSLILFFFIIRFIHPNSIWLVMYVNLNLIMWMVDFFSADYYVCTFVRLFIHLSICQINQRELNDISFFFEFYK